MKDEIYVRFSGIPTDCALNNSTFSPWYIDNELDWMGTRIRLSWLTVDEVDSRWGHESSFRGEMNTGMSRPCRLRRPALYGSLVFLFD